ncbi:hypothetical protein AHiyo8_48030 [Arthrobacter sp. Hiyo8]|nr:hypothetical protein AHiyo8_48030 [Arthrobacter sp. Hiyo8]
MPSPKPNITAGTAANDVGSNSIAGIARRVVPLPRYRAGRIMPGREPMASRIMPAATETSCMSPNWRPLSEALSPWLVRM